MNEVSRTGVLYFRSETEGGKPCFVKRASDKSLRRRLLNEVGALRALQSYINVPEVLWVDENAQRLEVGMSFIDWTPAHEWQGPIEDVIATFADLLSRVHRVVLPSAVNQDAIKRTEALERIRAGAVDSARFEARSTMSLKDFHAQIEGGQQVPDACYAIHGDYCLPNMLMLAKGESALIDWDNGGRGDPHFDLSCAIASISRNYSQKEVALFRKEYGSDKIDDERLAWYTNLDLLEPSLLHDVFDTAD